MEQLELSCLAGANTDSNVNLVRVRVCVYFHSKIKYITVSTYRGKTSLKNMFRVSYWNFFLSQEALWELKDWSKSGIFLFLNGKYKQFHWSKANFTESIKSGGRLHIWNNNLKNLEQYLERCWRVKQFCFHFKCQFFLKCRLITG